MPNIESRHHKIHESTSEIAQSRYTDKLIRNVVVKKAQIWNIEKFEHF